MATTTNVAEILTRVRNDKREMRQTLADLKMTNIAINEMANRAKSADVALSRTGTGAQSLASRLRGTTAPAIEETAREFADLRREALAATEAMQTASVASSGGGGLRSRLGRLTPEVLGREIVGLPSVMTPIGLSSNDIGQALRGVGAAGATWSSLLAAITPVLAVVAPLAAGFVALEASLSGTKTALDAAVTANQRYYDMLRQGATTADALARKAEVERLLALDRQELAPLQRGFANRDSELRGAGRNFLGGLFEQQIVGVGLALTTLSSVDDVAANRTNELTTEIANYESELTNLNAQIENGGFAINDVAAATTQWTEDIHNANNFLEDLSAGNLAAMAADAAALLQLEKEKSTATTNQLAEAEANLNAKREAGITMAKEAAEVAQAAAEDLAALEKTKARNGILAAESLLAAQIRIDADLADAQKKAADEQSKALTDAATEARKDMADAAEDARLDSEKAEREHIKTLRKIQREFNRDSETAIQNRDAIALDQAEKTRKDAIADENESYKERRDDIKEQLKRTQADIIARLNEQRQRIRDSYQQQLNTAADAARKALQNEQTKQQQLLGVQTNWQNAAIQSAKNFGAAMQTEINKAFGATGSGGKAIPIAKVESIPKLDKGGRFLSDGLVYGHAGEEIRNRNQQGIPPIIINGMGVTFRDIGEAVVEALETWAES